MTKKAEISVLYLPGTVLFGELFFFNKCLDLFCKYPACTYLCYYVHACCLDGQKKAPDRLRLKLQTVAVVRCHTGAGNQISVLCKSKKYSQPQSQLSSPMWRTFGGANTGDWVQGFVHAKYSPTELHSALFLFAVFQNGLSLHWPGWLPTHTNPPSSASQVLEYEPPSPSSTLALSEPRTFHTCTLGKHLTSELHLQPSEV